MGSQKNQPIEALRALISHTTSGPKKKALMVCEHEIYVELCEEYISHTAKFDEK